MNVNEIIHILSDIRSKYNCFGAEDEEYYRGLSEAIKMLSAQQWIPCNWHKDNEKLPDEYKSVLICIEDKIGKYVDVSYRTDYNRWERYGRNVNVVAWMPLPEPWQGEQE